MAGWLGWLNVGISVASFAVWLVLLRRIRPRVARIPNRYRAVTMVLIVGMMTAVQAVSIIRPLTEVVPGVLSAQDLQFVASALRVAPLLVGLEILRHFDRL